MKLDKNLFIGNTTMLVLKLLEEKDMYGYEMIETLEQKSENIFSLKAGTLYPILHNLEINNFLVSYENSNDTKRVRKYYSLTKKGKALLKEKEEEWKQYYNAINNILEGGALYAI